MLYQIFLFINFPCVYITKFNENGDIFRNIGMKAFV